MRTVLDTNTVVSALLFGGVPQQLLDLGRTGELALYTSELMLDELADVLSRSKFDERLAAAVPPATAASLLQRYRAQATIVTPGPIERTVPTDAADDMVIATALAANAELTVTGVSDLLTMHPFRGMRILESTGALENIRTATTGR